MPSKAQTRKYQDKVTNLLVRIFGEANVRKEWDVAKNSQDGFNRDLYCPRVDIAIHPINITTDVENNVIEINNVHRRFQSFVDGLQQISGITLGECNKNPRCFLAIEIEKKGSRKHMLGDIVNASSIGEIGIIVPWDDKTYKAFERIKGYLDFIKSVGKTSDSPKNLLMIPKTKLKQFLENFIKENH